ncbi:hypothetical protein DIZ27_42150 [Streptomyces sp. NWU339]|uniref:NDP-hexose 2,3-dehydratase family protein n=1 Tax=Streptomyces sp. NWU339 TaxID=2185284 RepID=UPI000D67DBDE|nr:hypothetical protein DIZ27_42150 [Streptomyces sp. NWU339]
MIWGIPAMSEAMGSVPTAGSEVSSTCALLSWLEARRRANRLAVEHVPFRELSGWQFDEHTGSLRHTSEGSSL